MITFLVITAVLVWIGLLWNKNPLFFFWVLPLSLLAALLMLLASMVVIVVSLNKKYPDFEILDRD